jgi:hypothetical protein
LIVDSVVLAARTGSLEDRRRVFTFVALELLLMAVSTTVGRLSGYLREVAGAKLAKNLSEQILEKALALELRHFEDSEVHDKMQNARREASSRPLSLVLEAFSIAKNVVTVVSYGPLVV